MADIEKQTKLVVGNMGNGCADMCCEEDEEGRMVIRDAGGDSVWLDQDGALAVGRFVHDWAVERKSIAEKKDE